MASAFEEEPRHSAGAFFIYAPDSATLSALTPTNLVGAILKRIRTA